MKFLISLSLMLMTNIVNASATFECRLNQKKDKTLIQEISFKNGKITTTIRDESNSSILLDKAPCKLVPTGNLKTSLICTDNTGKEMSLMFDKTELTLKVPSDSGQEETMKCNEIEPEWKQKEKAAVRIKVIENLGYQDVAKEEISRIALKRNSSYDDFRTTFSSDYIALYTALVEYKKDGSKCKKKFRIHVKFFDNGTRSKSYDTDPIETKCINFTRQLQEFNDLKL